MKRKTNISVRDNLGIRREISMEVGSDGNYPSGDILDANATSQLFFPASGSGYGRSWGGRAGGGDFWSSTFGSVRGARVLSFNSGGVYPQNTSTRCSGFAVRPVQ